MPKEPVGDESPSGAPVRAACVRKRRMVSEFIEEGFDLRGSEQTEEKTPRDKCRTPVTDDARLIIVRICRHHFWSSSQGI